MVIHISASRAGSLKRGDRSRAAIGRSLCLLQSRWGQLEFTDSQWGQLVEVYGFLQVFGGETWHVRALWWAANQQQCLKSLVATQQYGKVLFSILCSSCNEIPHLNTQLSCVYNCAEAFCFFFFLSPLKSICEGWRLKRNTSRPGACMCFIRMPPQPRGSSSKQRMHSEHLVQSEDCSCLWTWK